VLQGTGLAVYTAETALRNYLTTGGSLFSAPGESPDSYRTISTFLMIVSVSHPRQSAVGKHQPAEMYYCCCICE
jgi:hypothetical protein